MLKVLKYLKKTKFSVIAIIILLCIQAMADLALPDYTSKIVNIGIQQSGIKEVSPKVIRKSKMDEILLLTNDDNEILENYELISKDNLSNKYYEKYLKEYPKLETDELYKKKNLKNYQICFVKKTMDHLLQQFIIIMTEKIFMKALQFRNMQKNIIWNRSVNIWEKI